VISSLLKRRVPQLTGLYFVVAWGFVQFVDWAVSQYSLSPAIINLVVTLLLLLIPTIIVLAWRHGAPGEDAWTKIDAAAIGLNLIAAGAVLFVTFGDQELGAATTVKLVEDAEGNTVERVIPKAAFRRSALLYYFDNESGDSELDWFGPGIVLGVRFDLLQDVFVTPVDMDDPTVKERLEQAGFSLTDQIPLSLKREAAERRSLEHFMDGAVRKDGATLVVETRLYDTHRGSLIANHTYRGDDALEFADQISVDLRRDLGIPDWQIEEAVDLPAAELLTQSQQAFKAVVHSLMALDTNDIATARTKAHQAIALDSTFAMARFVAVIISLLNGDQTAAATQMAGVARYAYRLPEPLRLDIQVLDQRLFEQDHEAAIRSARYWAEIYPQDAKARRSLANLYVQSGDQTQALVQSRALLAIDPSNVQSVRFVAAFFRVNGDYDSALVYYERLRQDRPTDVRTRLDIARTLNGLGRFDQARDELEQAKTMAPDDQDPILLLARLDIREGLYEDAARRVERVTELVRTPQESVAAAGLEETIYYRRGQFARLEDAYRKRLKLFSEYAPPLQVVMQIDRSEFLRYGARAGYEAGALQQLDSLRNLAEAPWNLQLEVATVRIHLDLGDVAAARESVAGLRSIEKDSGTSKDHDAFLTWIEASITELEDGNCSRALERYDYASDLLPLSGLYRATRLRCLTSLERWSDAEEEAGWLLERYQGYATYRLDIARYHAARGQTADALSHVEAALNIWSEADAEYIPAQEARALLAELDGP